MTVRPNQESTGGYRIDLGIDATSVRPHLKKLSADLVESARYLLRKVGHTGFTVNQVVDQTDTSLKSFYKCYRSKDELLIALFQDDARNGAKKLEDLIESNPETRLRTAVVGLFGILAGGSTISYARVLMAEHLRLAESRPVEMSSLFEPFYAVLTSEIDRASLYGEVQSDNTSRDGRIVFHLVISHMHALDWNRVEIPPEQVAEELWGFCSNALRSESVRNPTNDAFSD